MLMHDSLQPMALSWMARVEVIVVHAKKGLSQQHTGVTGKSQTGAKRRIMNRQESLHSTDRPPYTIGPPILIQPSHGNCQMYLFIYLPR